MWRAVRIFEINVIRSKTVIIYESCESNKCMCRAFLLSGKDSNEVSSSIKYRKNWKEFSVNERQNLKICHSLWLNSTLYFKVCECVWMFS